MSTDHIRTGPVPRPGRWAMAWLLVKMARNPVAMYRHVRARYGDTVWLDDLRGGRWLFISRPDDVRRVHRTNHRGYGRGSLNEPFTAFLGRGLLTSERDTWVRHRRLLGAPFHADAVSSLLAGVREHVDSLVDGWMARAGGAPFDVCPDLERFAYRVVAYGLFDLDPAREGETLAALDRALAHVSRESFRMFPVPRCLGVRARRWFARDMALLDDIVASAIAAARATPEGRPDLLRTLVVVDGWSDQEIRDEVLTMLHAGQHTVASGLAFALHLIASHPRVQEDLARELEQEGEVPLLDAVLDEALRLYPPAWGGVRETLAEDTLAGITVPAGTPVVFSQFITHRDPDLWRDAEHFCPHRIDRPVDPDDFRYFPFGGGPHLCLGRDFALREMRLVLGAVLRRFTLRPMPGRPLRPHADLDLIPRGGVHLDLAPRPDSAARAAGGGA